MEEFGPQSKKSDQEESPLSSIFHSVINGSEQEDFLAEFTEEEQQEIKRKQQILSSLAYFIGKDFQIPVELNSPGGGWHWDFENNVIRIDPKTLLEGSLDELRYLICHEGGHRRVSRTNFIPLEIWRQPGFAALMNFIEDPRNDNFISESYPRYRENLDISWGAFFEEEKGKIEDLAKDRLGTRPRFMRAGYEYIRQWFNEIHDKPLDISEDLPQEVQDVVRATLEAARSSWWRYPSRQEADRGGVVNGEKVDGEKIIRTYAEASYNINLNNIWPEFKKLIEQDAEDQEIQKFLQEMMENAQQGDQNEMDSGNEGDTRDLPEDLKNKLTPEEERLLKDAIDKAIEDNNKGKGQPKQQDEQTSDGEGGGESVVEEASEDDSSSYNKDGKKENGDTKELSRKAIDLDSIPEDIKQKIKEYIDSLPEEQKNKITQEAKEALKKFEDALNEELSGKLSDDPEKMAERKAQEASKEESGEAIVSAEERVVTGKPQESPATILGQRVFSEKIAEMEREENAYEKYRREVLPIIDQLEAELRQIFVDRTVTAWKGGFKGGKRIDIKKRIQEKAKDVPAMESRAWQRREMPKEKDYAISLLVDISGSMYWDNKSREALKSIIVLAEVLNRLGINVEILGFNDEVKEYQQFGDGISRDVRDRIGEIINDASSKRCNQCKMDHNATDIGFATQVASERLAKQKAIQKFLITISDYQFEESPKHPANKYELKRIINEILKESDVHMVGLGIGRGTDSVNMYYPNSVANMSVNDMAKNIAKLIKDIIDNYGEF